MIDFAHLGGAGSLGQVEIQPKMQHQFTHSTPKIVQHVSSAYANSIFKIHAGNHISAVSTLVGAKGKNFYSWGGNSMIETAARSSTVRDQELSLESGQARGGGETATGVALVDTASQEAAPQMLACAYDNMVILQERSE